MGVPLFAQCPCVLNPAVTVEKFSPKDKKFPLIAALRLSHGVTFEVILP